MYKVKNTDTLPDAWEVTTLAEACDINPGTDFSSLNDNDLLSFVPMPLVEERTGKLDASNLEKVVKVRKGYTRFLEGDVLFAKITPCMENGKVALATGLHQGFGAGSTEFHVLRTPTGIENKYILFYLLQAAYRHDAQHKMTGTAGQKRVPSNYVETSEIPVPPTLEQQRIISKIEELFSDLDAGETSLRKVQKLLSTYRQSVLKAAVSGELTRDWREQNRNRLESGDALLQRILQFRREQWHRGGKYEEPKGPNTQGLPDLPQGWTWTSPEQIYLMFGNGLSRKPADYETEYPILRISAVRPMSVDASDIRFYEPIGSEKLDNYWAKKGDLLFTRYNGSGHLVGVCGLHRGEDVLHPDKIIKMRILDVVGLSREYLEICLNAGESRKFIKRHIKTTAGQQGIAGSDIKLTPIPLPSPEEQVEIASVVETKLSQISSLETWCAAELQRSGGLRQSILKAAFSGQLVPQDPTDEPASALLERIRAERADREATAGKRGRRRRAEEAPDDEEAIQEALW